MNNNSSVHVHWFLENFGDIRFLCHYLPVEPVLMLIKLNVSEMKNNVNTFDSIRKIQDLFDLNFFTLFLLKGERLVLEFVMYE